jgi:membrane-bound lytic murein transglycosylase D
MNEKTRSTQALALALMLPLLAPALSQAADSAPSPIAAGNTGAPILKPLLPPALAAAKSDEYKDPDLWGRIRSGYAIPDIDNNLVAKHVQAYVSHPDSLTRTSSRASLYLYHVVQELEKRGMPTELALLPVIESAFNPQALSNKDAAGIWQFVPGTGRDFNLQQNMFKDERRGVLASTDAALTYLQRLYTMFGDWQLALAAYNWGEGNVQKAIQKNRALGKPTDFESLAELMPAETRNYVPKLQAVKNIIANPGQYGVTLPAIDNQPYFTTVDKTSDIDLTVAAQLAEMSVDEFKALNPQFKKPVITGDAKILLPKENAEKFHLNLAQWSQKLSSWTTHKITSAKESIASLASKFDTTPEVIRQANNIPPQMRLKAGSTILVPRTSTSTASDITESIADSAQIALESDRGESRHKGEKLSGVQRIKASAAHAVAALKRRVSGHKVATNADGRKLR